MPSFDPSNTQSVLSYSGLPGGGSVPKNRGTVPNFSGDSATFLQSLYQARPEFVRQQGDLLKQFGTSTREAIFTASPELKAASDYITKTFSDPFGGSRETYEDAIRGAQAARGFTGGGSGVTGEEARYLTNYAERRRQELLPQAQAFGNNLLQLSGLGGPPDLTLGAIGALALQNRNYIDSKAAADSQSLFARSLYGSASLGGSGEAGQGTPDFFARQQATIPQQAPTPQQAPNPYGFSPDTSLAEQAKILYASGILKSQQDYLDYIGQGRPRETVGVGPNGQYYQL